VGKKGTLREVFSKKDKRGVEKKRKRGAVLKGTAWGSTKVYDGDEKGLWGGEDGEARARRRPGGMN